MKYDTDEHRDFAAKCVSEGLLIDPDTAVVEWWYINDLDPYGVVEVEEETVGRGYFARRPDGPWVHFGDLPEAVANELWDKHIGRMATPLELPNGTKIALI